MNPPMTEKVLKKLGEGEKLTSKERVYFEENVSFQDFYTWAQMEYGIDHSTPEYLSKIISTFQKKVPKGFENAGFSTKRSRGFRVKNGTEEKDVEDVNIEIKTAFNTELDELIENSYRFVQITNDYDILGEGKTITGKKNREKYTEGGTKRLEAFKKMMNPDNEGEADVMLKVVHKDGRPWATNSAKKLLDAGVNVYNYEEGEKFGAGIAVFLKDGWRDLFMEMLFEGADIKELSKDTGLTQAALKRIKTGERPTPKQALVLRKEYEKKYSGMRMDPVEVVPYAFFICRDFKKNERTQPEEPQMHPIFNGIIVEGWDAMARWIISYAEERKTEDVVNGKIVEAEAVDKKFLGKHME